MNSVKTVLLLGLLSGILLFGGEAIGGTRGLEYGLMIAIGMNFFSYFFSDKLALMSYSAQAVTPEEQPEIYQRLAPIVQGLSQKMGLPMPKLWVIPEDSPNAFATGRDPQHASVAVTEGIMRLMNDRELEGVLAHELGHVLHRDILISSIAATIASAITFLSRMAFFFGGSRDDREDRGSAAGGLLMMILAPIAALMIQMAISRTREFDADAASVKYTGTPDPVDQCSAQARDGRAARTHGRRFAGDGAHVHPESLPRRAVSHVLHASFYRRADRALGANAAFAFHHRLN